MASPSLSRVSPTSYAADGNLRTMQLFGSNFLSGDTLTFIDPEGGAIPNARAVTFASGGELDYQFDDASDAGTWQVQVNSPDGTLHSGRFAFTVAAAALAPSLSRVSPTSYAADNNLHTMQLFGSDFLSGDTLTFIDPRGDANPNARAVTFASGGELDYQFDDASDAGTWQVQVNSPDGTLHSGRLAFMVPAAALAPSLGRVSPTSYAADNNLHTMQLFGSDFLSGDTLTFIDPRGDANPNARAVTFASGGELDYQFDDASDAGTWQVQVNSPDGTLHSGRFAVTVDTPPPTPDILADLAIATYGQTITLHGYQPLDLQQTRLGRAPLEKPLSKETKW